MDELERRVASWSAETSAREHAEFDRKRNRFLRRAAKVAAFGLLVLWIRSEACYQVSDEHAAVRSDAPTRLEGKRAR